MEDDGETRALALPSCLSSPPPCWLLVRCVRLRTTAAVPSRYSRRACRAPAVHALTNAPRPRALWAPPPIHTPILHRARTHMVTHWVTVTTFTLITPRSTEFFFFYSHAPATSTDDLYLHMKRIKEKKQMTRGINNSLVCCGTLFLKKERPYGNLSCQIYILTSKKNCYKLHQKN